MNDIHDINTIKLVTKYWLFKQLGGGKSNKKKWTTLEHNGVVFPSTIHTTQNTPYLSKARDSFGSKG